MIRNISQKQYKKNIVRKNTLKGLQQIKKLILLLQHLDTDLSLLKDENLIASNDVDQKNFISRTTDQLDDQRGEENKSQEKQYYYKQIQSFEKETQLQCQDILYNNQRNKKKRI